MALLEPLVTLEELEPRDSREWESQVPQDPLERLVEILALQVQPELRVTQAVSEDSE